MNKHALGMVIGCLLPLALLFVLPRFGVSTNTTIIIAIGLMLSCHLFMGRAHKKKDSQE